MTDIQATSVATSQVIGNSGRSGSLESLATERKVEPDSSIERKEVETSSTLPGVGDNVDIQA